jgi:hypothetical protein
VTLRKVTLDRPPCRLRQRYRKPEPLVDVRLVCSAYSAWPGQTISPRGR